MNLVLAIALFAFMVVAYRVVRRLTHTEARSAILKRDPRTMTDVLNQMDVNATGLAVLPDWQDCPCCGYPTFNKAASPICILCSWESGDGTDEGDGLEHARMNFREHGAVYSPEEAAEWLGAVPSEEQREWQRQFMELCDRVRSGHLKLDEWYWRVSELGLLSKSDQ